MFKRIAGNVDADSDMLSFEGEDKSLDFIDHSRGLIVSINNNSSVAERALSKAEESRLFEWLKRRQ